MPKNTFRVLVCIVITASLSVAVLGAETKAQHDARMQWWREARFGLFIHWGLYAIPAGEWGGKTIYGEWIRNNAHIPIQVYDKFVGQFNPVKFNADEWVRMAKDAGMKYIVITSKHHDGFAIFDSKVSDFDVMATPFKRDILKELAAACRKQGMKLCFYHSIMDWHHPDYLPRRDWEAQDRPAAGADYDRYVQYLKAQIKELLANYGDIGVLWFDGEWETTWTEARGRDLYDYVRGLQSSIIINNRVGASRSGLAGFSENKESAGDFGTPEQTIPATGLPGLDWETCMTMNENWGYNKTDKNFKSAKDLLQKLADIASKGGNFLLNVGPTSEGLFPAESVERLRAIGVWTKVNGESIYGTQAGPFKNLSWGRCTLRAGAEGTRLYLHVFDWPKDGRLIVPGLLNDARRAYLLSDAKRAPLTVRRAEGSLLISVPAAAPDAADSVVVLDVAGPKVLFEGPGLSKQVLPASARIH
jgi:alpha-L-fucosidase